MTPTTTRLVPPYSARRETLWVLVLLLVIIAAMAVRFASLETQPTEVSLTPYQDLDSVLSTDQHLVYRTMLASVSDIHDLRAREGLWPEVLLLEEEGLQPFARDLMPAPADRLQWASYDGGTWVDYLGTPDAGTNRLSYILRLIDLHGGYHPHPHPGVDYDPELRLAAQVWVFERPVRSYPGERLPEAGWRWILSSTDPLLSRRTNPGRAARVSW